MFHEVMLFTKLFHFYLWRPLRSAEHIGLHNFGKRHYEEHFLGVVQEVISFKHSFKVCYGRHFV